MTWAWFLWISGWALAVDAMRRPAHKWPAADRNRSFWIMLLILMAPIFLIPYLVGVLPRLAQTSKDTTSPKYLNVE